MSKKSSEAYELAKPRTTKILHQFFSSQGDQVQNNLDKMEAGAGKVACRGARVNIGDIDEMVSTKLSFL